MPNRVKIEELKIGDGETAVRNSTVRVRYDGYLNRGDAFQQAIEYTFDLDRREVIAGLRYGVEGMKVGGRRRIRVGSHLAYGANGVPGVVPPDAVLVFEVELLEVWLDADAENDYVAAATDT
jgi:FKBP-type peptidyl-prolyl cis-trans isomerase FkpA